MMPRMKILALVVACIIGQPLATLAQSNAPAQRQPTPAQVQQQERMRSCNAEAGTRKLEGDPRRAFMSECLAGRTGPAAGAASGNTQQDRMRSCNAEAGTRKLEGDARRSFMSQCLSGGAAAR